MGEDRAVAIWETAIEKREGIQLVNIKYKIERDDEREIMYVLFRVSFYVYCILCCSGCTVIRSRNNIQRVTEGRPEGDRGHAGSNILQHGGR